MKRRADVSIEVTTTIKEMLLTHPETLRVLLKLAVPVSCAGGTVAEAAQACGRPPATFVSELLAAVSERAAKSDTVDSHRVGRRHH